MTMTLIGLLAVTISAGAPADVGDMVYIPAGEFVMGTSQAEVEELVRKHKVHPSLFAGETPRRKVHVKAFYIDRLPVTNADYQKFVATGGHHPPGHWGGKKHSAGQGDWPVTNVGWNDAHAYAKWAGKRLPTEAEWEKAARGTEGLRYPWGNEWKQKACRVDTGESPQTPTPLPVGCFPAGASPYGVLDLVGNVAQWTSTPSQPVNSKRNWAWYTVKGAAGAHQLRFNFRAAARNFSAHSSRRHSWLGFRCAMDAPDVPHEVKQPSARPARPLAKPVPAAGPDASAYGTKPITLSVGSGHSARIFVPYFPQATFGLNMPEQVGVTGFPFSWGSKHTPLRWKINDDRTHAIYQCTFGNRATLTVTLEAKSDCVDFTIAIRNLTEKPFSRPASNTCFNNHGAPYFVNPERDRMLLWTDEGATRLLDMPIGKTGEPLHGGWSIARADQKAPKGGPLARLPMIAVVSRDRQWIVAQVYAAGVSVANNAHYTCLHTRPRWPDIPAGEERALTGKVYFLKGGPDELLARWKRDFGRLSP